MEEGIQERDLEENVIKEILHNFLLRTQQLEGLIERRE